MLDRIPEDAISADARAVLRRRLNNPELIWRTAIVWSVVYISIYIYTGTLPESGGWLNYTLSEWQRDYAMVAEMFGGAEANA
jgi:hypothetical protein